MSTFKHLDSVIVQVTLVASVRNVNFQTHLDSVIIQVTVSLELRHCQDVFKSLKFLALVIRD